MKHTLIFLTFLSLLIIGCDKNSDPEPEAETKTELITKSTWKYESAQVDQNKDGTGDFPLPAGTIPACFLDNTITFQSNGSGMVSEGTSLCPGAPASAPITWNFTNNESTLNFGGGNIAGIEGQLKIVTLTDTKLTLSKDTSYLGISAAILINLGH